MCKTRHAFHGGLCGTRTLSRNVCAHCGVCTLPEAAEFWGLSGQAGRPRVSGVERTGLGQCRAGAPVTAAAPLRCPCPLPSSGADVGDRGRTFEPPRLARNSRCPGKARLPRGWPCVLRGSLSCWYPSARPSPRSRWPRSASPAGSEGSPPATASGSLCREGREKPPAESGAAKALMMPVEGSGRGPRAPATHRRAGTRVGPGVAHAALHALLRPVLRPSNCGFAVRSSYGHLHLSILDVLQARLRFRDLETEKRGPFILFYFF